MNVVQSGDDAHLDDLAQMRQRIAKLEELELENRQLKTDLENERNRWRTLINNMPIPIYMKDIESRFVVANQAVASLMGAASGDELIGKTDFDFYPKEVAAQFYEDEQKTLRSGQLIIDQEESSVDPHTGEARWQLTTKIIYHDHQGEVAGSMGVTRDITRLKLVSEQARNMAAQIGIAAERIRDSANQQKAAAKEQDVTLTQTTQLVDGLHTMANRTVERAQQVAEVGRLSMEVSREGQKAVTDTIAGMNQIKTHVELIVENMQALSERTRQIGQVIDAVNAIADRSKLLALNASIEAARAGAEGRGFAVVASEVRNLADQSRKATAGAQDVLTEIQQATRIAMKATEEGSLHVASGMALVEKAGQSIDGLAARIVENREAALQIAASTQEQAGGMNQLVATMLQIKEASSHVAGSIQGLETSIADLLALAQQAERVVQS